MFFIVALICLALAFTGAIWNIAKLIGALMMLAISLVRLGCVVVDDFLKRRN